MRALWSCAALLFLGCNGPSEPAGSGAVSLSPERLDFGTVPLDQSETLTFTLSGGPAEVLSVSLVEGEAALWTLDRAGLTTLDGSADVSVTFTPRRVGSVTGRVQVRTSSESAPSLFVELVAAGAESTTDADGDGYSPADGDCDDDDPDVFPGAPERCNGVDDDCDGEVPEDERDADFDGVRVCAGDCDDEDDNVYPGAPEICDGKDSDCVGGANDEADLDGDGYTVCDGDCDDDNVAASPVGEEVCDGLDNDCNGAVDDLDRDGDGFSLCSPAGDCDDDDPNAHPLVVAPNGNSSGLGTDADPLDTLEAALANLDQVCRTIYVEPGTYGLSGTWSDGALRFVGRGNPEDVEIVPTDYDRILTVAAGGDVIFETLTLAYGMASGDGGAVNVANGGKLTLRDVIARENSSSTDGGAVAVTSGTLILEGGCRFEDNQAMDDGGAIAASSSVFRDQGSSIYVGNTGSQGGALFVSGGSLELRGAELRENEATDEGGALAIIGAGTYHVQGNRFVLNQAATAGGGIALRDVHDPAGVLRNNAVQDNVAGTVGGGIAVTGASAALVVANNTLIANEASGHGGGIHVAPGAAADLSVLSNIVGWSHGLSGVYVAPGSSAVVQYNTGYFTNTLVEFAGAASAGADHNVDRDPRLVAVTPNDGNPDNDNLDLQPSSPEIDSGPDLPDFNDRDGSRNDRGLTGGPGASP